MSRIPDVTPETSNADLRRAVGLLVQEHNSRLPKEVPPPKEWSNSVREHPNPDLGIGQCVQERGGGQYLVKMPRGNELMSEHFWRRRFPKEAGEYLDKREEPTTNEG